MSTQFQFEPTWESLSNFVVPQWYQDAKFGIFIHWGIYSVPAFDNEWYSRNMYRPGSRAYEHHRETWGEHTKFGYKDFIPLFKGENFDADEWTDLFQRAGARYIVPVAEHHDGFAMYDSVYSQWTAARIGPKRDVLRELAIAARKRDLVFGVSHHRAEHWWFMNGGMTFDSDVQNPEFADFYGPAKRGPDSHLDPEWNTQDWKPRPDAKFLEDWLTRLIELIDNYEPQLIYFDWWIEQIVFEPYIQRATAHYYNRGLEWGKGVAINSKHSAFPKGTAVFDVERGKLNEIRPQLWQTDTSISNNSWGYLEGAHDYKTSVQIIHDLIDIVSKNGTLLLNVGPRPDGTIPEPEQAVLLDIGRWLSVNGEAIYGTRPYKVYGEGPTEVIAGSFQETNRTSFTGKDIRFTTKGNILYAIVLGVPENGDVIIESLCSETVQSVQLVGGFAPVEWSHSAQGLSVKVPTERRLEPAFVLKIE